MEGAEKEEGTIARDELASRLFFLTETLRIVIANK